MYQGPVEIVVRGRPRDCRLLDITTELDAEHVARE
jgi:hypothetical protein